MSLWILLSAYLVAINYICFVVFWWDKEMALSGGWRIRESTLLALALFGGGLGGKAAQKIFRHKTRKEPFRALLNIMVALNVLCLVALAIGGAMSDSITGFGNGLSIFRSGTQNDQSPNMPHRFGPGS